MSVRSKQFYNVSEEQYWKDVERAYLDNKRDAPEMSDDWAWGFAKERAHSRYFMKIALDKAHSGEKTLDQAFDEDYWPFVRGFDKH